MKTRPFFAALMLFALVPALAVAKPQPLEDPLACRPTPAIAHGEGMMHKAVVPSGELVLPAGKAVYAPGERVFLSGRVVDAHCVPVSAAIIDLWQVDGEGHSAHSTRGARVAVAPHFTGSGRAITDNLGRFRFVTVFPGPVGRQAPVLHVRITHPAFPAFSTLVYFAYDHRNDTDPVFMRLTPEARALLTANVAPRRDEEEIAAQWNVTLKGVDKHRHF